MRQLAGRGGAGVESESERQVRGGEISERGRRCEPGERRARWNVDTGRAQAQLAGQPVQCGRRAAGRHLVQLDPRTGPWAELGIVRGAVVADDEQPRARTTGVLDAVAEEVVVAITRRA